MKRILFLVLIFTFSIFGQQKRAITVDDLWAMKLLLMKQIF